MKIYEGKIVGGKKHVTVEGQPLQIRLYPHDDTASRGLSWGDESDAAKNLAYSLLIDAGIEFNTAETLTKEFFEDVVSKLDPDWELADTDMLGFCNNIGQMMYLAQEPWTPVGFGPAKAAATSVRLQSPAVAWNPNYRLKK